jgi:hypothetical protein
MREAVSGKLFDGGVQWVHWLAVPRLVNGFAENAA